MVHLTVPSQVTLDGDPQDFYCVTDFTSGVALNHLAEFAIQADVMDSEMVEVSKDYKPNVWVLSRKQDR